MNGVWTLTTQLALVAIIVSIATTIALLLRSRRPLYVRFATFAISIALFYVSVLVTTIIEGDQLKETALAGGNAFLASIRIVSGAAVVLTASIFFDANPGRGWCFRGSTSTEDGSWRGRYGDLGATPLATSLGCKASQPPSLSSSWAPAFARCYCAPTTSRARRSAEDFGIWRTAESPP